MPLKLKSVFLSFALYHLLFLMLVNANVEKIEVKDTDNVFFKYEDLNVGTKMPIHFGGAFDSKVPRFLPKEKANLIPFSSQELPFLIEYFGFQQDSPQAKAMEYTLNMCEMKIPGETKRCVTSLESMLDFVRETFNSHVDSDNNSNSNSNDDGYAKVLSTSPHPKFAKLFQNYTIVKPPRRVPSHKMVACHMMVYPHAVFHCHYPDPENRVFEIPLRGEDGAYVDAVANCHMNSTTFDPNLIVFHMFGTNPGSPVCHFLPSDDLVWVPASTDESKETYGSKVFAM